MFIYSSLADYQVQYKVVWAEDLPADTPPNDIVFAEGNDDYIFRFSESETGYHEQDFVPLARKPHRYLEQNSLGQSYGLSSFIDEDAARHHMLLPQIRKKFKSLIKIRTIAEYGVLKHTPSKNNKDHFTWWHTQAFMQKLQAEQIIIKVE